MCLFGAKSTLLYARLSSTFDLVTSIFFSQQRETKEMEEQKTPQGLGRNSCWRQVRRDGWQRLVEFVCRVKGREHLSGLPGLYFFNSADGKHEVPSAPWVSSVPGQWANGREAIANTTSRHDLSASVTITLS